MTETFSALKIFLIVATVVSLVVLYRALPNRRVFAYFCISLVVVFVIAGLVTRTQQPQEPKPEAERQIVAQQQAVFIGWYTEYQKDIDQLDRNWQLYHNIIESFTAESIEVETLHERLERLESEARIEQVQIYTLKAPAGLGEECNVWIEQILRKTRDYTDAQTQTIALSKAAAEAEAFQVATHEEQVHMLQNIMIREAPTGLFTASELSSILKYFEGDSSQG